uniref:Putative reverse transcriptase/maturase n=1 Tax=Bulboplastis apyrenoidosa TaxID=1070855 RepID=A0A1Y9TM32_9RHOD|nr:putative reverse transcriptase/maturase [Bulboplastis apyrenoidosa]ARO90692.1 putative reverse transcriptase/maturase [Bulboplastis apyrenoidosa]
MELKESTNYIEQFFDPNNRSKEQRQNLIKLIDVVTTNYSKKLKRFQDRNSNIYHVNYKVFHLLYDPYTFINAYAKISKNKGALTKSVVSDASTMEFFGQKDAINIANKFKQNAYISQPVRRTLIPQRRKPGKKRPIDTNTQKDRIVQEALRNILECVFEPEFVEFENKTNFRATNFGFRPNKSCFKAVENFKIKSQTCNYIIEGDISSAYNSVNHKILIKIIEKRIKDKKFLNFLKQLLKSGIMEQNHYVHSLTGVPQGGILSPLLFNIYMFEFDKFIYKIINKYSTTQIAKKSSEYESLRYKIRKLAKKRPGNYKKEVKKLLKIRLKMPSYDLSTIPKQLIFVRYADHWLLGINSTKNEAIQIKRKIRKFLHIFLKLQLDNTKTVISHYQRDGIRFLGYEIKMWDNKQLKTATILSKNQGKFIRTNQKTTSRKITIRPEKNRIIRNLYLKKICDKNGYPVGVRQWSILEEYRIVELYRSIMLGIINYYIKCDNLYALNLISYILQYSCAKTLAVRKKMSMLQIFNKYTKNLKIELKIKNKGKVTLRSTQFLTFTDLKTLGFITKGQKKIAVME